MKVSCDRALLGWLRKPSCRYVTCKAPSIHARLVGGTGIGLTRALLWARWFGARSAVTARFRCLDEARKQRMGRRWPALELGMKLTPHEVRMFGELDDLDQPVVWAGAAQSETGGAQAFAVVVVELEAMAVPFADFGAPVDGVCSRTRFDGAGVGAESHRSAFFDHAALVGHQIDDGIFRVLVELGAACILDAADVARELDHRQLHPEADAEVGHLVLARI